jgi:hypothetical protein
MKTFGGPLRNEGSVGLKHYLNISLSVFTAV